MIPFEQIEPWTTRLINPDKGAVKSIRKFLTNAGVKP